MRVRPRPLWRCPKCSRTFVTRHVEHTCKLLKADVHLQGKSREVTALYRQFLKQARACGPLEVIAYKTGIALRVRIGFCWLRVLRDRLAVSLLLPRVVRHPRITKVVTQ